MTSTNSELQPALQSTAASTILQASELHSLGIFCCLNACINNLMQEKQTVPLHYWLVSTVGGSVRQHACQPFPMTTSRIVSAALKYNADLTQDQHKSINVMYLQKLLNFLCRLHVKCKMVSQLDIPFQIHKQLLKSRCPGFRRPFNGNLHFQLHRSRRLVQLLL